ncbi:hypothetical protein BOTBODRAFT_112494 [Botryobasidium botryosum FD-172 SS1]|uniref:Argonaute-like protein n=1 Tax=Botryobasidium botryosum (strain FD-172 SS1) TaxID=930990 RepID=A0A067MDJ4_BOTB1|nr:hypothetical protein BOTBODRAFT_112494 [Botryobasidium botryosum FD-172 SS1]
MPPRGRGAPRGGGGGGGGAGRGRGGPAIQRGGAGPAIRGGPRGGAAPTGGARAPAGGPIPSSIHTVGIARPGYGEKGRVIEVRTNHFASSAPDQMIYHYDVISGDKALPARFNLELITMLQTQVAPQIFTPRVVYDGRKNIFSTNRLNLPDDTQEFSVVLNKPKPPTDGKPAREPKAYKIRLTKVAEINPEVLQRFLNQQQSHDNTVLTAITALNVAIRMEPTLKYPFNVRSFFTDREQKAIGGGIVLWRGYFQSIRPTLGRMVINVDISTGTMFKPGPLIDLCLDFLTAPSRPPAQIQALSPRGSLQDRDRLRLQRFLTGVRIITKHRDGPSQPKTVKKLTTQGANGCKFQLRTGETQTVADYFKATYSKPLRFPDLICVELGSGALVPLELCEVPPGQIMRRQVPPERTKAVLDFATMRPQDRLGSIVRGLDVLAYGQSEYLRSFSIGVDTSGPLAIKARVLDPPTLKYGGAGREASIVSILLAHGHEYCLFFRPATIRGWAVIVYERPNRFTRENCSAMVQGLRRNCQALGMDLGGEPAVFQHDGTNPAVIASQMRQAGLEVVKRSGAPPQLFVLVLPEGATDIYHAVKHFGDISMGVATQCLKSSKCYNAKDQYYANVCLKINVKLGGINSVPDARSVPFLADPSKPTVIMGADVIHPAPGAEGRPSFSSLVANVDQNTSKYIATSRVQESRKEIIVDLADMVEHILKMYMQYRQGVEKLQPKPSRIVFYRDGVSEGQFQTVIEEEVPLIKQACAKLGITASLTLIVVGKRHHVRFFPPQNEADRSGNCPAGTVVDNTVTHPTEFDFYLQSHGGLLGTSRPAHYNILVDENNFTPDAIQQLSFALCHVYARATRSVSIPAPVYYADIVCARAKHHFSPGSELNFDDSATQASGTGSQQLLNYQDAFKPLHINAQRTMYFS